jgi:hypothetical protein
MCRSDASLSLALNNWTITITNPGSRIEVVIAPPDSTPMTFRPIVIAVQREREIRWLGSIWIRGLFDGEHSFRLESDGRRTHLFQTERFSGILVGRLSNGILRETQRGFVAMNQTLKQRAESRSLAGRSREEYR